MIRILTVLIMLAGCGGAAPAPCDVAQAIRRGATTVEHAAQIAEEYACGHAGEGE